MLKTALTAGLLLATLPASAALPPQYQNRRDLEVMLDFIQTHPRVEAGLNAIDLDDYTVRFGRDCIARFVRETSPKPPGWVGPADPLVFDSATCPVDYDE
jgi:hypothetical protein